jgi:hypothetical protein
VRDFRSEATICLAFADLTWDSPRACLGFLAVSRLLYICKDLLSEALRFLPLMARSQPSLAAEILFLRKQLAFYLERKIKPRRFDDVARLSMLPLAKLVVWKSALPAGRSQSVSDRCGEDSSRDPGRSIESALCETSDASAAWV